MLISAPETIQEILVNATRALDMTLPYYEARLQAELLLAHTLQTSRSMVLARLGEVATPELRAQYAANVARRAQYEPIAYIIGYQRFFGLDFVVDRRVLIPRHETELLVERALQVMQQVPHGSPVIVDVGTGSGAIALALAKNLPHGEIIATEISPDALAVAQINAARLDLAERVRFVQGDLLAGVDKPFDILVCNLPYVPSGRFKELAREIREFEPRTALDGGADGLGVMRRLLQQLRPHAARGARALLEISEEQGKSVVELVRRTLPSALAFMHKDLEGLDRVMEIQLDGDGS